MCFALYAGTSSPLPRKEWQKDDRCVTVEPLSDQDAAIKTHFSKPEVQYIGSSTGCSCNFRHAMLQNGEWPECEFWDLDNEIRERLAESQRDREALVDLLRNVGDEVVELYGVWDGDFAEAPQSRETIPIKRILDTDFLFKERGFYMVTVEKGPE